ncbi:MFS transporter [Marinilabilia salmonicolor]|jgi:Na+/melibiose symporter-like transporter|uniref:Sugar (Glycoside-pentoside-hexuronide) transporter n=1 Tax=Marinilabilia salmonicolor TaxID=989 RepID=A0A2T0XER7_9BACT|nr:MFS transporter [Marinilabilia salmonicolor]PRY97433.1 sugar (glycoside-pentoside-hexuronide) transporter [Marinilabilia salmonicolor]RCW35338.1 sugar (glycoside-pentoside-hexuronide) transporter [Marinilabilia salmonicolor]
MSTTERISLKEKIGYSLGDLAANLIFQTLMTFLAFFYTDVYKIPPSSASAIIFAGGMVGAFFTPVMGMIADRTKTRWGKFRPWILWTSVPFGVIAILAFSTPDFSTGGKIAYAMITYILLVIVYAANNLPYSSLSGVITGNMSDRNSISSYRFTGVMIAQFVVQVVLLPLVFIVGDGDRAAGFEIVMGFFAVIGIVFFLITFFTTRERIVPSKEQTSSVKQDLSDLFHNRPWIMMLILTTFIFITMALKSGVYVYYFENYLDQTALATFLTDVGFNGFINSVDSMFESMGFVGFHWPNDAPTSGFSLFNAVAILMMLIGIAFSKGLADKYGKRDVFIVGLSGALITQFLFLFLAPDAIGAVYVLQLFHGFFYGLTIPLLWAMIADVADYSEWKNNRRATAIVFSAMAFGLKVGMSMGGAILAGLLALFGYNEQAVIQPDTAIQGIKLSMSVFPALTFLVGLVSLIFYNIDKSMEVRIEKELLERRGSSVTEE